MRNSTWWTRRNILAMGKVDTARVRREAQDKKYWSAVALQSRGLDPAHSYIVRAEWIGQAKREQEIFLAGKKFNLVVTHVPQMPGLVESDWSLEALHYLVTVMVDEDRRSLFTTCYSMGSGHSGTWPRALGILGSLSLDARSGSMSFRAYCDEFGDDYDSRKAEKLWDRCVEVYEWLREVGALGILEINFDELEQEQEKIYG